MKNIEKKKYIFLYNKNNIFAKFKNNMIHFSWKSYIFLILIDFYNIYNILIFRDIIYMDIILLGLYFLYILKIKGKLI